MDRSEFKRQLERHKNQIDASTSHLQSGFEEFHKLNCEFYEFLRSNCYDFEERLTKIERENRTK